MQATCMQHGSDDYGHLGQRQHATNAATWATAKGEVAITRQRVGGAVVKPARGQENLRVGKMAPVAMHDPCTDELLGATWNMEAIQCGVALRNPCGYPCRWIQTH